MSMVNLFVFPYAGASASVYERWRSVMHPSIRLIPVELPGRGRRFDEPLLHRVSELVANLQSSIIPALEGAPYAMFGHSLGSILAFEMSRELRLQGYPEPVHVFVSGRAAPHTQEDEGVHLLPDDEFVAKIYALGGTPPNFFDNDQLRSLFLPVLKADYAASETYRYDASRGRLTCGLTVFSGLQDGEYDPLQWREHTKGTCESYAYQGGHFFLHEHMEQLVQNIESRLLKQGGVVR